MADDLVPPAGEESRAGLRCEFCECSLTKSGEVKSLSPKAKKIRRLEEDNERAAEQLTKAQAELADVRQQLSQAQAALAASGVSPRGHADWLAD